MGITRNEHKLASDPAVSIREQSRMFSIIANKVGAYLNQGSDD